MATDMRNVSNMNTNAVFLKVFCFRVSPNRSIAEMKWVPFPNRQKPDKNENSEI